MSQNPGLLSVYQIELKGDHHFSDRNVLTVRYGRNPSNNSPSNEFKNIATPDQPPLEFTAQNAMVQDSHTFNPTTILTVRGGLSRLFSFRQVSGVDLKALGFSADVPNVAFPVISVSGYSSLGTPIGAVIYRATNTYSFQASLNKIIGNHSLKFGVDFRAQQENSYMPTAPAGQFSFLSNFTQGPSATSANSGSALAAMFLGDISSGAFNADSAYASSQPLYAGYVQDDWRISPRLTLNLGLRYDLTLPRTDRFDRLLNFDPYTANPVTNNPGVFLVPGRTLKNRREYDVEPANFGPRIGFAYQLSTKTVIRGGSGLMYMSVFNAGDSNANVGLSPTFSVSGQNAQLSTIFPQVTIDNPFPQGVTPPVGATQGLALLVGQSANFISRYEPTPHMLQWNFGIQHQFAANLVTEIAYVGSEGKHLLFTNASANPNLNTLAPQYLALGNQLSQQVANPFFGKITSGPLAAATVPEGQLLLPFPQFTGVYPSQIQDYMSNFQSLQLRAEKRMSGGFTIIAAYQFSKLISNAPGWNEAGLYQDINNRAADKALSSLDFPSRFVASYLYELPFGAGKKLASRGVARVLAGGWQLGGITTLQQGNPFTVTALGASPYITGVWRPDAVGNPTLPSDKRSIAQWFNTNAFAFPANSYTFGNGPRTLPRTLRPGVENFDITITKMTHIKERMNLQFRVEAFNAFNHPNFMGPGGQLGSPTFGQITAAREGRDIQFGLKLLY